MLSGIRAGHDHLLTAGAPSMRRPQFVEGLRQRVLLAGEPGDEAATEHEAACLEPAQRPHDLAPGHLERLPAPQLPGDDAPPHQQLLGHGLGQRLVARQEDAVVDGRRPEHLGPGQERPPAFADAGPHGRPAARQTPGGTAHRPGTPAVTRREQRPHRRKGVRSHEAPGHEIPESLVDFRREPPGQRRELGSEAGAAHLQRQRGRRRRRRPRAPAPAHRHARSAACLRGRRAPRRRAASPARASRCGRPSRRVASGAPRRSRRTDRARRASARHSR